MEQIILSIIGVVFASALGLMMYLKKNHNGIYMIVKCLIYLAEYVGGILDKKGIGATKKQIVMKTINIAIEKFCPNITQEEKEQLIKDIDIYVEKVVDEMNKFEESIGINKDVIESNSEILSETNDKIKDVMTEVKEVVNNTIESSK